VYRKKELRMGDLLRIDLTTGAITEETIPRDLITELIGGKGVGTYLLSQEVRPGVDALSPQNKLIFALGPATGTSMFGTSRYSVFFVSPMTGGYCECYSGGHLAGQFARTGYKVVILQGASDAPVYIEVAEGSASIHPADDLWGLDTYEAEEKLLAKTAVPKAQACVIGPAGENLVRFACIENNKWHSLGRGGPGAVMGSKKVKGLVFHGDRPVEVARPEAFKALVKDLGTRGKDDAGVAAYRRGGTVNMVRILNNARSFPTRYWTKGRQEDFELLTVEHMREHYNPVNGTCPPCLMQCLKLNTVPQGHRHAGLQIEGPEYETIYVFGGICDIVDFGEIMYLNDICDRMGIDTMSAGNLAGLAIEASRRGLIDLGLEFGDADGVADFLRMMVHREGIGDLFADGILRVEEELGLRGVAVHVKGMEPAGYDPRSLKGMGLTFVTAARGACHLRSTFYKAELAGLIDPAATEGKAAMLIDWEDRLCVMDTMIYCRFYRDLAQLPFLTEVVNAAIGTDYTVEQVKAIGARIIKMTHDFNLERGIGFNSEHLPAWITGRPQADSDLTVSEEEMTGMVRDYYEIRGWGEPI
jgi:aldehyde:ferredoxin oxidoreductase